MWPRKQHIFTGKLLVNINLLACTVIIEYIDWLSICSGNAFDNLTIVVVTELVVIIALSTSPLETIAGTVVSAQVNSK